MQIGNDPPPVYEVREARFETWPDDRYGEKREMSGWRYDLWFPAVLYGRYAQGDIIKYRGKGQPWPGPEDDDLEWHQPLQTVRGYYEPDLPQASSSSFGAFDQPPQGQGYGLRRRDQIGGALYSVGRRWRDTSQAFSSGRARGY